MQYLEGEKIANLEPEHGLLADKEYLDCEFFKCHFIDTQISNCVFKNCIFTKCVFSRVTFKFTNMLDCELKESMFIGICWSDVKRKGFGKPIQACSNSVFKYNTFYQLDLRKFCFSSSSFVESYFDRCNLAEADFKGVNLGASRFTQNNLKKADFREATNYLIDVKENQLKGAKFTFPEVVELLRTLAIVIE